MNIKAIKAQVKGKLGHVEQIHVFRAFAVHVNLNPSVIRRRHVFKSFVSHIFKHLVVCVALEFSK